MENFIDFNFCKDRKFKTTRPQDYKTTRIF